MQKRAMLVVLIPLLCLLMSQSLANAAEISSCGLDSEVYLQGQSGYVKVDVYNNLGDKIRISNVTVQIDYYYLDGISYSQTFYTNSTLPIEILQAQSNTSYVPFTLPSNISPGYTRLLVTVSTDYWNAGPQRWVVSDSPTAELMLYVESPYKQQFEQEQSKTAQLQESVDELEAGNQQLQGQISELTRQLEDLQTANSTTTTLMYVFVAVTVVLVIITVFLQKFARRSPL